MTRMEVRIAELRLRIESTGGATQLKPGVERLRNSGNSIPRESEPGKGGGTEGDLDHRTPARPSPLTGFSDFGFETTRSFAPGFSPSCLRHYDGTAPARGKRCVRGRLVIE